VLRFSPLLKNQHIQIPIRSWRCPQLAFFARYRWHLNKVILFIYFINVLFNEATVVVLQLISSFSNLSHDSALDRRSLLFKSSIIPYHRRGLQMYMSTNHWCCVAINLIKQLMLLFHWAVAYENLLTKD